MKQTDCAVKDAGTNHRSMPKYLSRTGSKRVRLAKSHRYRD